MTRPRGKACPTWHLILAELLLWPRVSRSHLAERHGWQKTDEAIAALKRRMPGVILEFSDGGQSFVMISGAAFSEHLRRGAARRVDTRP